jgi:hypothetical protein
MQVHAGLPVRCIEVAVLDGIVIEAHGYVEGGLDVRDRSLELYVHSIPRAARHRKAVRFRNRMTAS